MVLLALTDSLIRIDRTTSLRPTKMLCNNGDRSVRGATAQSSCLQRHAGQQVRQQQRKCCAMGSPFYLTTQQPPILAPISQKPFLFFVFLIAVYAIEMPLRLIPVSSVPIFRSVVHDAGERGKPAMTIFISNKLPSPIRQIGIKK
jgi:hypothetical protein